MLVLATGLVLFTIGDSKVAFLAIGVRFSGAGACKVPFLGTSEPEFELGDGEVAFIGCVKFDEASPDLLVGFVEVTLGRI